MAAATNLTIKKYDGTTDVVYTVISGAPGDKMPAIWRNEAFAPIAGNRPVFTMASKAVQNGSNSRVVEAKLQYPELFTTSTTGVTAVRLKDVASAAFTINLDGADVTHQETNAQFLNLCKILLPAIIAGFAPV